MAIALEKECRLLEGVLADKVPLAGVGAFWVAK